MKILALFEGSSLQESEQNENSYFPNTVPFSNTKFSDYKFDRLDGIFNQRPINQLIWYETKLKYWKSKYPGHLKNHIVPNFIQFRLNL